MEKAYQFIKVKNVTLWLGNAIKGKVNTQNSEIE